MADFNMDEDDAGGGEWLATYGDLVTLLLCFFILLYSMSIVDIEKFKKAAGSLHSIGTSTQSTGMDSTVGDTISDLNVYNAIEVQQQMDDIEQKVKELIDEKKLQDYITVEKSDKGVLLRFKNEILFDSGDAELKSTSKAILAKLSEILREYNKNVKIEGHTDNVPIKNSKYPSNWQLSAERAITVVRFFTEGLPEGQSISPAKFEIAGYGEYRPIAANDSDVNKQKNRRIEILIIK